MNEHVVLPRTGDRGLTFSGRKIASSVSIAHRRLKDDPKCNCQWFEIDVYESAGHKTIVAIRYRFAGKLKREVEYDSAKVIDDVQNHLDMFNPMDFVEGYPPLPGWEKRNEELEQAIRRDWELLVDDVVDKMSKLEEPEHVE